MPSLAILYPAYVDNAKIFGCPATKDKPFISIRYHRGAGGPASGPDVLGQPATNPARYSGFELSTELKCSYFYDERTNFRNIGPGQAIACDADGQTWMTARRQQAALSGQLDARAARAQPRGRPERDVLRRPREVDGDGLRQPRPERQHLLPERRPQPARGTRTTTRYLWDGVNARAMEIIRQ